MITNADCTIVRADDNGEYCIAGTYPCMWQECETYETSYKKSNLKMKKIKKIRVDF